jgi:hypothetical protein
MSGTMTFDDGGYRSRDMRPAVAHIVTCGFATPSSSMQFHSPNLLPFMWSRQRVATSQGSIRHLIGLYAKAATCLCVAERTLR